MKIKLSIHCQHCGEKCIPTKDSDGDIYCQCPKRPLYGKLHSSHLVFIEQDKEQVEIIIR